MVVDSIPQQAQEKIAEISNADLVVGVLADLDRDGMATLCDGLRELSGAPRIAVLQNDHAGAATQATAGSEKNASPFLVSWPWLRPDTAGAPALNLFEAYQSLFATSEKLGARACCVVASKLEAGTTRWVGQLTRPLLEGNVDLVVPRYARHKFEGLLNSSIISPMTRSLYGKRIHNPMGPDLGVSQRLFQKMLGAAASARINGRHPLISLAPAAVCDNLQVCEVHVGARIYPPTDWANLSSLIAQVLSPVFLDMERNAACWQRMRSSVPVPTIGTPLFVLQDAGSVDIDRMIETFQLGNRDLQEIWSLVLPPSTLVELKKLSRLPPERFHMSDQVWVQIIYDFALAHRLRTISRDHLLKSMTPLYLAWIASYARDIASDEGVALEQRFERLAVAYESCKSYLVSRWRWPDRFNP